MKRSSPASALPLRTGIHPSIARRLEETAEGARAVGCDSLPIFSAYPRIWSHSPLNRAEAEAFSEPRQAHGLEPPAVHHNGLRRQSMLAGQAFIPEAPMDRKEEDRQNVRALRRLAGEGWEMTAQSRN